MFCSFINQKKWPATFTNTDFKYVDNQPDHQKLKGLKVSDNKLTNNINIELQRNALAV
jgi:hypothetical protein